MPESANVLRSIGEWTEAKWAYNPVKQTMVKLFEWRGRAVSRHGAEGVTLRYVSIAKADPRKMDELTYVASQEGVAIAILEAMVSAGLQGFAYLTRPDIIRDLDRAVINEVQTWTERKAFPQDYAQLLHLKIKGACDLHVMYMEMLARVQAHEDEDHLDWGLRFEIEPMTAPIVVADA